MKASSLQQGIYYSHSTSPRNSFSVIFLSFRSPYDVTGIRKTLLRLWNMYQKLQKGLIPELGINIKNPHHGDLSILIGYGPGFFELNNLKRKKPAQLSDASIFQPVKQGDPILPKVGLKYSETSFNEEASDHVVIQFIGETQMATHSAIVETWKLLRKVEMDGASAPASMRSFYTGYNRPDGRGWLGFHDGVSNIKSSDRLRTIQIDRRGLDPVDYWTANGTYMAFLRIAIDLTVWESIPVKYQERVVGREKTTGCPLVRIDERGNNVFAGGCPVPGTTEITDRRNERFREYIPYSYRKSAYSGPTSVSEVGVSHVALMRTIPERIFRQGYEFLEPIKNYPYFRVGLNFVSFQRGVDIVNNSIKNGFGKVNFGTDSENLIPGWEKLLSVLAAGVYLVPPFEEDDEFPGDLIFNK